MSTLQSAAEKLKTELSELFPVSSTLARVVRSIGTDVIIFSYMNAASSAECTCNIDMNDPAYMRGMIDQVGQKWQAEVLINNGYRSGVKFRKITADDPCKVVEKVVAWFAKNRETILALGKCRILY